MKLIALTVALTLLGGAGAWYSSAQYRSDQELMHIIFSIACEMTYYDCTDVEVPAVRRSEQVDDNHLRGLYMGGEVVWIEKNNDYIRSVLTIFHEAVHYIQFTAGGVNPLMISDGAMCVLEREAMEATNAFTDYLAIPHYKRDLKEWKRTYGCP